jgi:hypothetical protein
MRIDTTPFCRNCALVELKRDAGPGVDLSIIFDKWTIGIGSAEKSTDADATSPPLQAHHAKVRLSLFFFPPFSAA